MNITHKVLKPNFYKVEVNDLTLYFSYNTVIAYSNNGMIVASENVWSKTTAKHLGEISSKASRIPHDVFERKLQEALNGINN